MESNAGESFQMEMIFNIFPHISLHCKLVPVQYWEYEYGLLPLKISLVYTLFQNGRHFSILLFDCKLALLASFKVNFFFEFYF